MTSGYPFSTFDMSSEEAKKLFNIYTKLSYKYSITVDHDFSFDITPFTSFSNNDLNEHGPVLKCSNPKRAFYLCFPEVRYKIFGGRYSTGIQVEYQAWGYYELKEDFGHILIKSETLLDKIQDLINPIDLDFEEDKEFSKRFMVVTNDKVRTQLKLNATFRALLKDIPLNDLILEINGHKLIIGEKKIITEDSTIVFADFLNRLAKTF